MNKFTDIYEMLDWNMPDEIQRKGRNLAKSVETIEPFIQPIMPKYNKNIWGNCAIIIGEMNDEKLKPYLVDLMKWLQDMNWPGAFCIQERLFRYSDTDSFRNAMKICIEKAHKSDDLIWKSNLYMLMKMFNKKLNLN